MFLFEEAIPIDDIYDKYMENIFQYYNNLKMRKVPFYSFDKERIFRDFDETEIGGNLIPILRSNIYTGIAYRMYPKISTIKDPIERIYVV
jgi:hypothetical protein